MIAADCRSFARANPRLESNANRRGGAAFDDHDFRRRFARLLSFVSHSSAARHLSFALRIVNLRLASIFARTISRATLTGSAAHRARRQ